MKKYAVAVLSFFENVNEVKIVEAENEVKAMLTAVGDELSMADDFETTEDLKQYYYSGEYAVSKPVEIGEV